MKRLSVLLPCLILVLLCGYAGHHVHCSEETPGGSVLPAPDRIPEEKLEKVSDDQGEEEWPSYIESSYDVGLETERTSLEMSRRGDVERDQTVKTKEPDTLTEPGPASDAEPAPEPELQLAPEPAPQGDSAPATSAVSADAPADPHGAPEDVAATPTSQVTPASPSSSIEVPSADCPVGGSVDAEPPATDCEVTAPPVAHLPSAPPAFDGPLASLDVDYIDNASSALGPESGTRQPLDFLPDAEQALPELDQGGDTSHELEEEEQEQAADVPVAKETDPSVPGKEDIPTFDEWKKKVMEVEKEKSQSLHTTSNGGPHSVKKVQKNFKNNYASVECGAKILSANTEAKSTSAILMENMDLYMLNPCSTKIWFVIELCEPIQVKQLDIANFELFSSTPRDFLVSISDRYPTNKWIKLGTFHARDERTVQSFPLDEQLYAKYMKMFIKYIKVELLSHFGSEHFCPLSLIRVFGTSMVEEYEEIAEPQYAERLEYPDEDYDYPPGYVPTEDKASKNLLGSATNAILNMVNNIAANVLGSRPELEPAAGSQANSSREAENMTSTSGGSELLPTPSALPGLETLELESASSVEDPGGTAEGSGGTVEELATPAPPEESRIVTLVLEEEEEELEHSQSTVTLLGAEEEEERGEDESKGHSLDPRQLSSLSCAGTLLEYLHRRCSAAHAPRRLHPARRKVKADQDNARTSPVPSPEPVPTPTQELPADPVPQTERPSSREESSISMETTPTLAAEGAADLVTVTELLEPSHSLSLPPISFVDSAVPTVSPAEDILEPSRGDELHTDPRLLDIVSEMQDEATKGPPSGGGSPSWSSAVPTADLSGLESDFIKAELPLLPMVEPPASPALTATKPLEISPPTDLLGSPAESDADRPSVGEPQRTTPLALPPETSLLPPEPGEEAILVAQGGAQLQRSATDFYAELQNSSELSYGNGNQVHGSNQKESVFMRLNNRIKALEMNMSLSGRYLEELSQRYRKQMEEMQRAFNKTIIKLQNTSRIAEEQDQRQTESIQTLQNQLENITQLVLNLSITVGKLQKEAADRQSYLAVSLLLCLSIGLLLCLQCCRGAAPPPASSGPPMPKINHYPSPKRCFSSYDDMSLKRRVSCPLVRSKSFQFPAAEVGPDDLFIVEPLRFSPEKKKKRCKMKAEKADASKPLAPAPAAANGGPKCNGAPRPPPVETCVSLSRDTPSEGSSEGSSHSEEPPACENQPPPPSRMERRAFKRRRSRMCERGRGVAELLPALHGIMKGSKEMGVGALGVTALSGQV
ncbi:SUN domain-containing ossification factor isoform X2 [Brienomyrus brachyistius]|uniref:SUN domain-containing ossification factor isoform X2 n=1 Tax=Brienomyrus brachyistius TaxID=42636 RepID=UPI0020B30D6A|nr:SUN domain-containing ossification factor isoform X2 [Brienomyrus brachyistius]